MSFESTQEAPNKLAILKGLKLLQVRGFPAWKINF